MLRRPLIVTLLATFASINSLGIASQQPVLAQPLDQSAAAAETPAQVEVSLKNIQETVHRVRTAALDVVNDVEQRSMVVTGEPDLIQPIAYDDQKHVGWARKMLELGPALPPKRKWLDEDVSRLGRGVDMLQSDLQETTFPADKQAAVNTSWNEVTAVMQDVQSHRKTLESLAQAPQLDNISLGKEALAIYTDMDKLKKPWEQTVKAVRGKD